MLWTLENLGEELFRQGNIKHKGNSQIIWDQLKKISGNTVLFFCLLFKFKEPKDPIKDGPAA